MPKTTPEKHVLIVEDDEAVREALATFLEVEGYPVLVAGDGEEALRQLRAQTSVGIILLDLMMPVMNGWQFREHQLKDPTIASIPVLVVTADDRAAQRAADIGAAGFMTKPIEFDQLLRQIARFW
jgi:CheY-like chemotaxis protein